jgi:hypothetical protein
VRIAGGPDAHATATTHRALLHDVRQLMRHQAAIRGTGVAAQKDVATGRKCVRGQAPIQNVGLRIVVDAHIRERRAETTLHGRASPSIQARATAPRGRNPLRSVWTNRSAFDAHLFMLGADFVLLFFALHGQVVLRADLFVVLRTLSQEPSNLRISNLALQRQERVDRRRAILRTAVGLPPQSTLVITCVDLISGHELTLISH